MRRLIRLWKSIRLRMVEMQIAMIRDYNQSLEDQQQANAAWMKECREKEFMLAAELEGVQVKAQVGRIYMIEVGTVAFFIPHDADQLRRLMATYRENHPA